MTLQGGCITKLEQFLADHLLVIGAVGIGVACLQVNRLCSEDHERQNITVKIRQCPCFGMKIIFE